MIIPVRCFSCGFPIGAFYKKFKEKSAKTKNTEKILDEMGITRYCCRRMLISQADVIDEIAPFRK